MTRELAIREAETIMRMFSQAQRESIAAGLYGPREARLACALLLGEWLSLDAINGMRFDIAEALALDPKTCTKSLPDLVTELIHEHKEQADQIDHEDNNQSDIAVMLERAIQIIRDHVVGYEAELEEFEAAIFEAAI